MTFHDPFGIPDLGRIRSLDSESATSLSASLKDDAVLDSLGIGRQRLDVSLGVAFPFGTMAATFVNVGRSLSSVEEGGTSLALSGGISIRFGRTSG